MNCINCLTDLTSGKYCSNRCQQEYQYKKFIEDWKSGSIAGTRGKKFIQLSTHVIKYIFEKFSGKCCSCGIFEWCGLPICLEIDHIDGDSTNNKESNLRLLCPNCHSQTPTFRAKNKGFGRKFRLPL